MKKKLIVWILAVTMLLSGFWLAASRLQAGRQAQAKAQLEQALHRAAVSCYATEGYYPENLEQLLSFGVVYDTERFTVIYEPVAANLLPDITVIEP